MVNESLNVKIAEDWIVEVAALPAGNTLSAHEKTMNGLWMLEWKSSDLEAGEY